MQLQRMYGASRRRGKQRQPNGKSGSPDTAQHSNKQRAAWAGAARHVNIAAGSAQCALAACGALTTAVVSRPISQLRWCQLGIASNAPAPGSGSGAYVAMALVVSSHCAAARAGSHASSAAGSAASSTTEA